MKVQYTLALAVLGGAALGAAAVQGLHAQAKPPVYFVAELTVMDPDGYAKEYAPKIQANIKAHGGRLIALGGTGGGGAQRVTGFDGEPPNRASIIVWDSMERLQDWRNSADFQEARKIGARYMTARTFSIDGRPE